MVFLSIDRIIQNLITLAVLAIFFFLIWQKLDKQKVAQLGEAINKLFGGGDDARK